MIKEEPIWSFFLSTQSNTEAVAPSRDLENSGRITAGELSHIEPFIAFRLDLEASKAMEHNYDAELRKPVLQFTTAEHMTMFGRSLWWAYKTMPPSKLRSFALDKLYLSVGVTAGLPTITVQNRYPTERHFLSTAARIKVGIAQQRNKII